MTSAVGGGEGGPQKADKMNEVTWILYVKRGGSKNPKMLRTSYMYRPLWTAAFEREYRIVRYTTECSRGLENAWTSMSYVMCSKYLCNPLFCSSSVIKITLRHAVGYVDRNKAAAAYRQRGDSWHLAGLSWDIRVRHGVRGSGGRRESDLLTRYGDEYGWRKLPTYC